MLIGGSSIIPSIRNYFRNSLSVKVLFSLAADDSTVKGATRLAASFLNSRNKLFLTTLLDNPVDIILYSGNNGTSIVLMGRRIAENYCKCNRKTARRI